MMLMVYEKIIHLPLATKFSVSLGTMKAYKQGSIHTTKFKITIKVLLDDACEKKKKKKTRKNAQHADQNTPGHHKHQSYIRVISPMSVNLVATLDFSPTFITSRECTPCAPR